MARLYRLARTLGCKAVSYYRDGSRDNQVLTTIKTEPAPVHTPEPPSMPEPPAPVFSTDRAPDRVDRPKELQGATWQIPFDAGNLYVTVNHDGAEILEIFVTGPISASVGKLASKMMRGGFHPREVARTLETCTSTHSVWFNQRLLTSPEQVVAECIMIMGRRLANQPDSAKAAATVPTASAPAALPTNNYTTARKCPDCGSATERVSNCDRCADGCGWSKCG